jgi:winged helix-turn-helix DNA-binding protein
MRRSPRPELPRPRDAERRWSLLTTHALVLLCIAKNPETRVREIAEDVGISERGAHQIVADLVDAGYVRRARVGRRNHYAIEERMALSSVLLRHRRIASIVALLGPEPSRISGRVRPHHARTNGTSSAAKRTADGHRRSGARVS